MTGTKQAKTTATPVTPAARDIARGGIIDVGGPANTTTASADEPKQKPPVGPTVSPAIGSVATTIQGFSEPAPSIRQAAANDGKNDQLKKASGSDIKEHGGGIGPRQHWQSLMQEGAMKRALDDYQHSSDKDFFNKYKMSKRDFYNSVIDSKTQNKSTKPYKAPQSCPQCGQAHESCVCEDIAQAPGNDIPRKSVIQGYTVFYNPKTKIISVTRGGDSEESAIEQTRLGTASLKNFRMIVDKLIDRIDNQVEEGWSDRYVAQRTGRPRTPYSVYINGKKWKDFANDDHARAVMDKLKAKFKADGRDPSVITIAPTDIQEGMTEAEKDQLHAKNC
jgi:hypothetical protein